MKTPVRLLYLMIVVSLAAAQAGTITLASGSLTSVVQLNLDTSVSSADFRSDAVFDVADPGPIGQVTTTDGGAPAPNTVLFGVNAAATEFVVLNFDLGSLVFAPDFSTLRAPSTGVPGGPVADAALSQF